MPKKRSNGEGSIYKDESRGVWRGQITLGVDDYGKAIRKTVTGKTKKEIFEKFDELKSQFKTLDIIKANQYTVSEWISYYMDTVAKPTLRETSFLGYERYFNNHIFPHFGHFKLSELSPALIQQVYTRAYQNSELSRSTMVYIHNKFSLTMKYAVQQRILSRNPCEGVIISKMKEKRNIQALTEADQAKLVAYCYKDEYNYIFIFLLGTGMRIGEVLGLTWDCVDLKNKQVIIEKTMIEIHGNPRFSYETKTESSTRTLSVSEKILSILESQRKLQVEENHLDLVFPSTTFNFRTTANLRRRFIRVCNEAEIPNINLHALRHTFATRMLEKDISAKIISDMLGHKNISTTLNLYAHVLKEHQAKHIVEIDDFI